MSRADYLERKFGTRTRVYERVTAVGASVGIPFAFDEITVQPNTVAAHRLLVMAEREGLQNAVAEEIFRAYFTQGANVADHAVLADIAARAGLDRDRAAGYLASDEDRKTVVDADSGTRGSGLVDGVPYFIFNRKIGVPGAQPAEVLLDALEKSLA